MPEISGLIQNYLEGSIKTIGKAPVIEEKNITENGTYTAPEGVDGFSPVNVNVLIPEPSLTEQVCSHNGTYLPPEGYDGFSKVDVDVPIPIMDSITITENGTYLPASYNLGGFDGVVVNTPNKITMGNMFNSWIQSDMSVNYYGNKFDVSWAGGLTIGCQLYSNFDIHSFSKIKLKCYVSNVHYYDGTQPEIYKIGLGVSSTKPTDYSNVNLIGDPVYFIGNDEWVDVEYNIPNQTCYLYLNMGGWNLSQVEITLE